LKQSFANGDGTRQILNQYEADTGAFFAVYQSRHHMTAAMRAFLEFIFKAAR
jgi:DNA-binding transcriptional LysR family regulator